MSDHGSDHGSDHAPKALWQSEAVTRPAWATAAPTVQPVFTLPRTSASQTEDPAAVTDRARQDYLRAAGQLAHAQQTLMSMEMDGLIELAFAIGDELARHMLSGDRIATLNAIRESLTELANGAAAEIRISVADHAALDAPDLALVADASLSDGDFIISTPHERMLDTFETRRLALRGRMGRGRS